MLFPVIVSFSSRWRRGSRYRSRSRSYSRSYSCSRTPPRHSRLRRHAKRGSAQSTFATAAAAATAAGKKGGATAATATSSPKKKLSQKALLKEQTRVALEKLRSGKNRASKGSPVSVGDDAEKSSSMSVAEGSRPTDASEGPNVSQASRNSSLATNGAQDSPGGVKANADGASKSKKRRYRHASHRKRDYSDDSEYDDRSREDERDDVSEYSDVSRDEWGRVRRGRGTYIICTLSVFSHLGALKSPNNDRV